MKIGYARVSTKNQSFDVQIDALKKAGCKKTYRDVASGARSERPAMNDMIANLRSGDMLVIWKLDRLGRSLNHLIAVVNELMARDVGLKSIKDPIDTTTPQGRLSFNLFASLAEFERDLIRERTQAGLSAARARWSAWRQAERHAEKSGTHRLCGRNPLSGRRTECSGDRR